MTYLNTSVIEKFVPQQLVAFDTTHRKQLHYVLKYHGLKNLHIYKNIKIRINNRD